MVVQKRQRKRSKGGKKKKVKLRSHHYYNACTQQTTWERPTAKTVTAPATLAVPMGPQKNHYIGPQHPCLDYVTPQVPAANSLCQTQHPVCNPHAVEYTNISWGDLHRSDQWVPDAQEPKLRNFQVSNPFWDHNAGKLTTVMEPTSCQRRKNQLGYLVHQSKDREQELNNRYACNYEKQSKTRSKYGW